MISSDVIARMVTEVATGKPHTVEGPEALMLYDQLEDECAELREQGIDIEVPVEIPDL